MAVEAKRITGRLRVLFPKANLSKKRLDEISARLAQKADDDADDTVLDGLINQANEFMSFEDIAREDDRVRALEARIANAQDGDDKSDKGPEQKENGGTPKKADDDVPAWAKAMLDSNNALKKELEDIKNGRITETKKEQARKLFEKNGTFKSIKDTAKEFFFKQINVDSEESIEDQITALETQYNDLVQHSADSRDYTSAPPNGSGNTGKPTTDELDAVARML